MILFEFAIQFFPLHGIFTGEIIGFDKLTGLYGVRYADGDEEDLTGKELKEIVPMALKKKPTTADERQFENGTLVTKVRFFACV